MTRLFSKLFVRKSKVPAAIIPPVPSEELTLEKWRRMPNMVLEANRLHKDPAFASMLAAMRNDSPANYHLPSRGVQASDALLHLGEIQGFNCALNMLAAFAKPWEGKREIAATFESPLPPVSSELSKPIPFVPKPNPK